MTKSKKIISLMSIVTAAAILISSRSIFIRMKYVSKDFEDIDLDGIESIMIVAHPDDETLWGGSHLIDGNYLVVCITAGNNSVRSKELLKAMSITKDKCIMLGYPDKTFNKRNNWKSVSKDIKKDLEKLLSLKQWKIIVTHNPQGEYGHIHHIMTSEIVTDIYKKNYSEYNNLYYFGDYYKNEEINSVSSSLHTINEENYKKKLDIIQNVYTSQNFLMSKFGHMVKYESWNKYM